MTAVSFNDSRWTTLNKATHTPTISKDGEELKFLTEAETDWWRTPDIDSSSGLVYGFEQEIPKEGFEISVDVAVEPKVQVSCIDQAALFLKLNATTWIKTGLEYDNDATWAGVVVTTPYSDWSLQPPPSTGSRFTISLKGQKLKVYLNDDMIREVNVFGDGKASTAFIGVMGCSPKGKDAEVSFRRFDFKEGVRD